jgi:hypothetical protein
MPLVTGSVAAAGIFVGHWLAYALAHPEAHARRAALSDGHGWMALAQELVPLAAVATVAALMLSRAVRRHERLPARGRLARDLAGLQAGAFAALELAERLAGAPWSDLPLVLAAGLTAQAVVAWLLAAAIVRLCRIATRVGAVLARAAAIGGPEPTRVSSRRVALALGAVGPRPTIRAPPAAA